MSLSIRKIVLSSFMCGVMAMPVAYAQPQGVAPQATPVIVAPVERVSFTDEVEALGTLKAKESVNLTSTVTEWITEIHFEDGARVTKGDLLVQMDISEEQAELSEEESFLAEAQRQVNRLAPLVKKGAASASTLDERKREVLGAKARIEAIKSRMDKRQIRAPYDGVLGLRNISVGALAQPGTLITTIDDDSVMKLDFSVPEIFLPSLQKGLKIEAVSRAYGDFTFEGVISSVDSRVDTVTRSIQARALIDNADGKLKPGMLMQVELHKDPRQALIVPEEALIANGSDNFVLVIQETEDGITSDKRKVILGQRQFGDAEILDGLVEGDRVVTHGTLRVRPGAPLVIKATETQDETLKELLEQDSKEPAE